MPDPPVLSQDMLAWAVQANPREAFSDWVKTFQKSYADGLSVSFPIPGSQAHASMVSLVMRAGRLERLV